MSKKGYVVAQIAVSDPAQYEKYKALAGIAVTQYGGQYLARGGETHPLEGGWSPARLVIIEFGSVAEAKRFYDSPEYRAARAQREGAAKMDMLVVEGF